jgi:hypothetical protein
LTPYLNAREVLNETNLLLAKPNDSDEASVAGVTVSATA